MSAAATAAGYLYACGRIGKKNKPLDTAERLQEEPREDPGAEACAQDHLSEAEVMNWFRRLLEWPPVPAVISDAEWKTAIELTRISAYQAGLAEGELRGRLALANEIEAEFVRAPITGPDATRIRQRQVH